VPTLRPPLQLGVALDGLGWHPSAWRAPDAPPVAAAWSAAYWTDLVATAERGLLDFVSIDDSLGLQTARRGRPDDRTDGFRGRLDAVLIAARVGPTTHHVGLLPTATTTHPEPFHLSKAIATLDYVTGGRAGVQLRISGSADEAGQFGRRPVAGVAELFDEAADFADVVRRLWDSWEDDAEIRDAATGRFVDRNRLHYIDFTGPWFSVKGPSITPRPPQGQPLVAALAHVPLAYQLAMRQADVVFVTPQDADSARAILGELAVFSAARTLPDRVRVFADLVVFVDPEPGAAARRKAELDALVGHEYRSDAFVFVGRPAELADLLDEWHIDGVDGFRLRPGAQPHDLDVIVNHVVPLLQDRGRFRTAYEPSTLRGRMGLDRPANRYAVR
jgi:alkanesulfonate monooxygenase SsuD/methylene tetrahydromethanopterin reductase-like flavin-dependent oxidoreductase (luciferase family)